MTTTRDYVRRIILRQTDEEIKEQDKQIDFERERGLLPDKTQQRILMNEIRNAIELIENAPSKVASTFISSLLASRAIERINARKFELDEEAAQQAPVEQPDEVDAAMKEIELAMAQKNLEMMVTQDDLVRQQAAMSDPTGAKELFLKSYMYKDQIVTLKKVGQVFCPCGCLR